MRARWRRAVSRPVNSRSTGTPSEIRRSNMTTPNLDILCWNVRGLNDPARCVTVHEVLAATSCHIACFQETKLASIDGALATFLSGYKHNCFTAKPAQGTKGGILISWNDNYIDLQNIIIRRFSVTASVSIKECGTNFSLSVVYGPTRDIHKHGFLTELRNSKPSDGTGWLVMGDFNLIYQARDKNNRNLNLRRMRQFRAVLSFCELREIHLQNRKFTWSNERRRPTLVRLDRVFCNERWDLVFEHHAPQALPTAHSDHCPLLLSDSAGPRRPRSFRFENFWTRIPGFHDEVRMIWQKPTPHWQPIRILHHKLSTTAKHLRQWSHSILSDAKNKLYMALEVIQRLDEAQESRDLSPAEFSLRAGLKRRVMGLAVIERSRKKQASTQNFFTRK